MRVSTHAESGRCTWLTLLSAPRFSRRWHWRRHRRRRPIAERTANAKCYPTLQAAVDAALSTDRPLVLPRGSYRITAPLVIDYSQHAGTGFELISRGATIDGTAVRGPALIIECAADCFYFHQEGTLFVNADSNGPAVVFGKADFSDPQNSGKLDHLIVNNRSTGQH